MNTNSYRFDYTGAMQEFTAPVDGLYQLEVFGASGGSTVKISWNPYVETIMGMGGQGGYSKGYVNLNKGDVLYVCVGEKGQNNNGQTHYFDENGNEIWPSNPDDEYSYHHSVNWVPGTYNGGGGSGKSAMPGYGAAGGGATHIALTNRGELFNYSSNRSDILIVAGGGGGAFSNGWGGYYGGSGGGLSGGDGQDTWLGSDDEGNAIGGYGCGKGGQQTEWNPADHQTLDGKNGTFGKGHGAVKGATGAPYEVYTGGGGGGWIGGGDVQEGPGGGGSGYISGIPTITYKGKTYEPSTVNGYNSGNGAAVITLMQRSGPALYLGTKEISAVYYGARDITDIKIHN